MDGGVYFLASSSLLAAPVVSAEPHKHSRGCCCCCVPRSAAAVPPPAAAAVGLLLLCPPPCCCCASCWGAILFILPYLQLSVFMSNFNADEGFFFATAGRWNKWMERVQHLPLSMARLGCSSYFVGKWVGGGSAMERAVGQELASAFLAVAWPGPERESCRSEREASISKTLQAHFEGADTDEEKDALTFGVFYLFKTTPALMIELEDYATSANGQLDFRQRASRLPPTGK